MQGILLPKNDPFFQNQIKSINIIRQFFSIEQKDWSRFKKSSEDMYMLNAQTF